MAKAKLGAAELLMAVWTEGKEDRGEGGENARYW